MKLMIRLEDAAKFILAYLGTIWFGFDWWLFWVLLLLPDLSMIGYAFNTRTGAFIYNFVHHQGLGVILFVAGYLIENESLLFAGLLLFGHSAMDRVFGYGLKYSDDFKNTHLGWIGRQKGNE